MKTYVRDPGSVAELAGQIASGQCDPRELVERLLARAGEVEDDIQAWCGLGREGALREAEMRASEIREGRRLGPLHGIPFAVKDVIDVSGWPTRAGSPTRANASNASLDAEIVTAARAAGAIVLGKVHTTEFAYFDGPPPTRNPWNTEHTPGGSSAGPAAAVAAGMVPFSLGTQTAGSVVRPAAYCGIAAFKPTTLGVSSFGVVPLAPAFDTPGYFAYRSGDVARVASALQPPALARRSTASAMRDARLLRVAMLEDDLLSEAAAAVNASLADIERRLAAAGHEVDRVPAALPLRELLAAHTTIVEYELARIYGHLRAAPAGDVSERLFEAVGRGGRIEDVTYQAARAWLAAARRRFWDAHADSDALIVAATPDEAPRGMKTGDPRFIIPFTALAGPIMTVPVAVTANGLPLGVMVLGRPGEDCALIDASEILAREIELPRA